MKDEVPLHHILIVEDSPTQAEQLRWSLENEGFSVTLAHNAEQALKVFDADQISLVVSDIVMPGESGYDLCRQIKSSLDGRDVPVVLLSALTDPMTIIYALQAGADNFLTKPYEPQDLISRIRTALSNKALRAQGRTARGIEVMFRGKKVEIVADKERILDLLMSTFEDIVRSITELAESREQLTTAKARLENYARELEARVGERTSELRQRQRQLSDAQEIARIGDWQLDAASGALRMSEHALRLLGGRDGSFLPHKDALLALLHPQDRGRIEAMFSEAAQRPDRFQAEARFLLPGGKERICWIVGNSEHDAQGRSTRVFGVIQDITERRQMETRVQEAGERYRRLFEDIPDGVVVGSGGIIKLANSAALNVFGAKQPEDLVGTRFVDHFTEESRQLIEDWTLEGIDKPQGSGQLDCQLMTPGDTLVTVEVTPSIGGSMGDGTLQFIVRDVSKRKRMEEQLFQAQKMEAVGQLTGGISHDFNNLLAVIMGNLEIVKERVKDGEALEALNDAFEAACRGSDLTHRLLAFSRRQTLQPRPTSANELITVTSKLLKRALEERIELRLSLRDDIGQALVDPAQLEAAITNLAVNARDAMPEGGTITIATSQRELTAQEAADHPLAAPGQYVVVEVSDTGTGMAPEVLSRACDPFFTTKEESKGTGLGLSMVHGFVEQSGGFLQIESAPERGTSIRLFLPAVIEAAAQQTEPIADKHEAARGETVLVVEDNEQLRRTLIRQLHALGYQTIEAGNGVEAMEILQGNDIVDLLLTDLMMPGKLDGHALAKKAETLRPGMKILLTSGFSEANRTSDGQNKAKFPLLHKPYRRQELARVVHSVLQD